MPKFFVPQDQIFDTEILILGEDAHHIVSSLRMKYGDSLVICDKNKRDYDCIISSVGNGIVKAEIVSSGICEAEPDYFIRVFQCLPKGDKLEYIVQKAVETGASSIVPVYSSRCIAKPSVKGRDNKEKKTDRLGKIAYEAAGQCGRGIIPAVHECINFERAVDLAKDDAISFICYEDEKTVGLKRFLASKLSGGLKNKNISFFIGPEGGFSKEEISYAREKGIVSVSLGKRILRTETAACAVLSMISYETELR